MDNLAGQRILIVEDEAYIAFDLKRLLTERGACVLGPAQNLDVAHPLVERGEIDAAVLDVNLNGTLSYPLADALAQRSVPYMFITGYDGWSLPEKYRAVPLVSKPFPASAVVAMLEELCRRDSAPC